MVPFLLSFWPAIAAGSIAIPVVIHLINRRRFKIVPWAAMKFLLAAQKQTRKRMRIEQLLLLLCRMLILAFVLIAMVAVTGFGEKAWAWLGISKLVKGSANLPHRVHHIFVLDASLSMNQKGDGEQSAFETARQLAIKKIQANPSGHGYSVLILKDSPTWLVGEASQNARKVIAALEEAKPSHGNAAVAAGYSMISAKLSEAKGRFPVQAVYFFTDMQRSQWAAAAPVEGQADEAGKERSAYKDIQEKAATFFVDCGPNKDAPNLAVTRVEFDLAYPYLTPGVDITLEASVQNFSAENKKDVRAEVLIGKVRENAADPPMQLRVVDQASATVPAGRVFPFRFEKVKFPTPGTYAVQVKIGDDALAEDNARTIIITVREKIPLLLVNGKASADRFERATEYLKLALNPFPIGAEIPGFPLRPEVVTPGQFSDMSEAQLEKYDCIFWCDVGQFGVNDVRKIDGHLRRGGGFVVTLGDKAAESLDRYNELLFKNEHGLLPAKLLKKITAPPDHHFYFQNSDDNAFKEPPLAAFSDDQDRLTLRTAQFRQYVLAAIPEGKANAVLSFMPEVVNAAKAKRDDTLPVNAPAIVVWNPPLGRAPQPATEKAGQRAERQQLHYRGKVILLTSTVNMDWTSWPGSPSYGAMMHELTRLAVSGRLHEQSQSVGNILETYLPGGAEFDVKLQTPGKGVAPKTIRTQLIGDVNLFRYPRTSAEDTDISGIYTVETNKGTDVSFAVNVPASSADQKQTERDLARIDEARLGDLYPGWRFRVVKSPLDVLVTGGVEDSDVPFVPQPVGPDIANILLLGMLGLLFAEIILAWMFGHYTTTPGALTNAPPGPASTTVAAGIAILCTFLFAIGLYIVVDYWVTGDFLGFFPDLIRGWFERRIGVEPLNPGEGSNWNYERMSWLFGIPGSEYWYGVFFTLGAIALVFVIYKSEAPRVSLLYKFLLGALRIYLIVLTIWFLLPRPQISYDRVGYPDLVLLIDDTRSMGEPDTFKDGAVIERVKKLSDGIRQKLIGELPAKIDALREQIAAKAAAAAKDPDVKLEVDGLTERLHYWEKQRDDLNANHWHPSRLQLVQAILAQPEPHWLKYLLAAKKTKVHIFHLDVQGRATKLRDENGDAGDLIDHHDHKGIERSLDAIARLEPVGNDSRLGTAIKEVINHYRGSGLSSVIMFTDGVTTRDENIAEAGGYAASKGISLFFVGVGDEQELRDLKLQNMNVPDQPYVGDTIIIEADLIGKGYKDLTVPVVLSVKTKDGKEIELKRELIKVDPSGNARKLQFADTPKVVGKRTYRLTVQPPKIEGNEKSIPPANLRLERTIEVIDTKKINVLYVEGQPRYEFRYIKFLMEREKLDEKKNKSIDLTVLLLDADEKWAAKDQKDGVDKTAISVFPPTLQDLNKYDVLILGDCDPNHQKLKTRMNDIKSFVLGEDERGKKAAKPGGGILFIAGAFHNPHSYKTTPLASIIPVEPFNGVPPPELPRKDPLNPVLTQLGQRHPIFRFRPNLEENKVLWEKLTPMYWTSTGFKPTVGANVLAVHPSEKAFSKRPQDEDDRQPLVVEQYAGNGRSMFFGFDETWRWRRREDEAKFNTFWIQTMRYLSRARSTRTDLRLDRQTPYDVGEPIKITVQFPDNPPGDPKQQGPKLNDKTEVDVTVTYLPPGDEGKENKREGEVHKVQLAKQPNTTGLYQGTWNRTREGKYRFRLTSPDVSATQPDGEKPSADALVKLPPGELERLRMNAQEMIEAAGKTQGEFFTIANANEVLEKLPPGYTTAIASNLPPTLLWNQWWVFVVVLFLITSEWILRKLKHLL